MRNQDSMQKLALAALVATSTLVLIVGAVWGIRFYNMSRTQSVTQSTNPTSYPIGGFPMTGNLAPDFTLTDQFGHTMTLSSLTAQIMYDAKVQLGSSASSRVDLVAVNANPTATSIPEVQAWSINHGMLHQWLFLTGTAQQLQSVYHLYNVYVQVSSNELVEHDPILFIIDAQGHERLYFETLDSNSQSDLKSQEIGLEAGMQQWLPQPQ